MTIKFTSEATRDALANRLAALAGYMQGSLTQCDRVTVTNEMIADIEMATTVIGVADYKPSKLEEIRKKQNERNRQLIAYYEAGHTFKQTAEAFHISYHRIRVLLFKYAPEVIRTVSAARGRPLTDAHRKNIQKAQLKRFRALSAE